MGAEQGDARVDVRSPSRGSYTRVQLSLLNAGQNAVGAIPSVSLTDFRGSPKGLTTIARNLAGSLEIQVRAIIAPEG